MIISPLIRWPNYFATTLGLDGNAEYHGEMIDRDNLRVAVKRSDRRLTKVVFHELLHLDKMMKVAGGNKLLWGLHELVMHGVELGAKGKFIISAKHNPHVLKYEEQYNRYLMALEVDKAYITVQNPSRFGKPDLSKLPWMSSEQTKK